jgi:tyrosyl-tRNA synthetase
MLSASIPIIELLASHTSIFPSKAEAKKMLQGGGVAINKEKIESEEMLVTNEHLINNEFIVIQKGKKNYFLIQLVD